MRTFMDIANDESTTEENMKNQGLSFDPSYFKAKKEVSRTRLKHVDMLKVYRLEAALTSER